jgi:hypothetical protein
MDKHMHKDNHSKGFLMKIFIGINIDLGHVGYLRRCYPNDSLHYLVSIFLAGERLNRDV